MFEIPPHTIKDSDLVAADDASRGLPAAVADFLYRLGVPSIQLLTFLLVITYIRRRVSATTANVNSIYLVPVYGNHIQVASFWHLGGVEFSCIPFVSISPGDSIRTGKCTIQK